MKLIEIKSLDSNGSRPDWLTQPLTWVAIILVAAASAIAIDLWIWPPSGESQAQAAGLTLPISTPTVSLQSTRAPITLAPGESTPAGPPASAAAVLTPIAPSSCVLPDDWDVYTVQKGNTLHSVAQRYGTDVDTLVQVNCLNTRTVFVNQRIYVPGPLLPPLLLTPAANAVVRLLTDAPRPSASATVPTQIPTRTPPATALPAGDPITASPTPRATATSHSTARPGASATVPTQVPTHTPSATALLTGDPTTASPTARATATSHSAPGAGASATPATAESAAAQLTPLPVASRNANPIPTPALSPTPKTAFRVNIANRYVNIVLLGSDKRLRSRAWRTDTMIVLSVDVETNVVRLLSIPRDMWVYIPGHGNNRINTAELWGELAKKGSGIDRVKRTIHYNLGIPIHYYARVDFQGFTKIIDTVGGVEVDVDCPLPDIKLESGMHHMDGEQALRYARSRKSTSDFDRGRRQRKVLMSLWDQTLTMDIIPKLPELWVTMADSFDTDLPLDQVINLAYIGVQLEPQHILSTSIPRKHLRAWRTPQGASVLVPREDKLRTMLEGFYAPRDPASLSTVDKVRVQVLNGTGRRDADQLAAAALRWEGYKVAGTGQAARQDYAKTQVLVYNGDPATGEQVARQLKVPLSAVQDLTTSPQQFSLSEPVHVQVILGRDYNPCQR